MSLNNSDQQHSNSNGFHATTDPDLSGSDDSGSDHDDDESSVVELEADEFPEYFSERNGRLFHASSSPYPLPIDTPEQERMTLTHDLLRAFFDANYVGPVRQILDSSERGMALDVCTGNGKWAMEMAQEFPRIRFRAFDIVPIATRYPLENVQFEIDDVNSNFRWNDETFDFVHARSIALAVVNYRQTIFEIRRVLRSRGIFLSYEWSPFPSFDPSFPNRNLGRDAPASSRFYNAINTVLLQTRGLRPIADQVQTLLQSAGGFEEIVSTQYHIPIGTWPTNPFSRNIGVMCLAATERYADSVKPFLVESGWTQAQANTLSADFVREIRTVGGLTSILYVVHARKAQT